MNTISSYRGLKKVLFDARLITLAIAVVIIALVLGFLGQVLVPFLIAIVFAYFLEGGIWQMTRRGLGRRWAVGLIYTVFLLIYLVGMVGPLQLVVRQSLRLVRNYPAIVADLKRALFSSTGYLANMLGESQQQQFLHWTAARVDEIGSAILGATAPAVGQATNWAFTLLLVPVLVLFLLIDKESMQQQIRTLVPRDMELVQKIWLELEPRLANYVRGKLWEIIILTGTTTVVFLFLGFDYAFLMGLATGISVLVPYVGAAVVTLPIAVLGYTQWGFGWDLWWLLIAYGIIQFIDGNILVPVIFSEAVKIQPFYIILAVVVFGTVWGFWGVFLAVPLATLFKTMVTTLMQFRAQLVGPAEPPPAENAEEPPPPKRV